MSGGASNGGVCAGALPAPPPTLPAHADAPHPPPHHHPTPTRVNVVPFEQYVVPEGQRMKEGSRRSRKLAALAEARAARDAAPAAAQ